MEIGSAAQSVTSCDRSRLRSDIWSLVRIAQTCFGRSGGLAPVSLPLLIEDGRGYRLPGVRSRPDDCAYDELVAAG